MFVSSVVPHEPPCIQNPKSPVAILPWALMRGLRDGTNIPSLGGKAGKPCVRNPHKAEAPQPRLVLGFTEACVSHSRRFCPSKGTSSQNKIGSYESNIGINKSTRGNRFGRLSLLDSPADMWVGLNLPCVLAATLKGVICISPCVPQVSAMPGKKRLTSKLPS